MSPRKKKRILLAIVGLVLLGGVTGVWALRNPMEMLTIEGIEAARQRWKQAGVKDYRLCYTMSDADYVVEVRNGQIASLTRDGERTTSQRPQDYTVTGLFDILEMEIDSLSDPRNPFGGDGSEGFLRVRFHATAGYVERYLRAVTGANRSYEIRTKSFERLEFAESEDSG